MFNQKSFPKCIEFLGILWFQKFMNCFFGSDFSQLCLEDRGGGKLVKDEEVWWEKDGGGEDGHQDGNHLLHQIALVPLAVSWILQKGFKFSHLLNQNFV